MISRAVLKNRLTGEVVNCKTDEDLMAFAREHSFLPEHWNIIGGSIRAEGYNNLEDYVVDFLG